jgi:hypothetical protein
MERRTVLKAAGSAVLGGVFGAMAGGSAWAAVRAGAAPAAGADVLKPADRALIADIADTIIPTTDTPGAKAAGVPAFIEHILFDWLGAEERDRFLAGMRAFPAQVAAKTGKPFASLSTDKRIALLTEMLQQEAPVAGGGLAGFVSGMKQLTVYGYYTSEIGATQELSFNIVPGSYDPCAHVGHGDHAPALANSNPRLM